MTDPYRAMCAELADVVYEYCILHEGRDHLQPLVDRARALLAEPEPKGPTDEELWALGNDDFRGNCYPTDAIRFARAVLAKWGRT